MKQKKKLFHKSTIVKRTLSFVLTFAMVLTMGMVPQMDTSAEEETAGIVTEAEVDAAAGEETAGVVAETEEGTDAAVEQEAADTAAEEETADTAAEAEEGTDAVAEEEANTATEEEADIVSEEETGTVTEEADAVVELGGAEEIIVLIVHFKNESNWETVNAKYGSGKNWDEIPGYEDAKRNEYGVGINEDAVNKDWYTYILKVPSNVTEIDGLFNNGAWGDNNQTNNYSISISGNTEVWISYVDSNSSGEVNSSYSAPEGWLTKLKVHFKNVKNWATVNAKYGSGGGWDPIPGYENAKNQEFGVAIAENEENNGWYTYVVGLPSSVTEVKGLFNNGAWGNGNQTSDYTINISGDAEAWVTYTDESDTVEVSKAVPEGWVGDVIIAVDNEDREESTIYTYNIYYFDQTAAHMDIEAADVWAWEVDGGNLGAIPFTSLEKLADGNEWLKATLTTAATNLGLIPRSKGAWTWQTGNHYFENTEKTETCNIYIIYGDDANTYTELPTIKEQRSRYVIVEYDRSNGDYEGWNIYSWNTGFGSETELYTEEVNGKHIITVPVADYDVDLLLAFCMRQVVGEDPWADKDGGDHFVNVPADQVVVKAKFVQGEGITEILPYNTGYELDGVNSQIHFYYRDDALFKAYTLDTLKGKVQVVVNGETFNMEYDAVNERYYYDYNAVESGEYSYHYVVDGEEVLDAFNPNTTEDGKNSVLTCKMYDVAITASVLNAAMDYNENNVLSVSFTGADADKITAAEISSIEADLSALGLGKIAVDPELMKASIACLFTTAAGEKTIPVTLKDIYGNVYETAASVTVTERIKTSGDFDWDEAIIYFAVTDRFFDGNTGNNEGVNKNGSLSYHGGDFAGLNQKLDYLKELGVNTIWITPIVENSAITNGTDEKDGETFETTGYHGYWATDFTKLNSHLGTEEEFSALLSAAHSRGMKIMVDVVINHAGYNTEEHFNTLIQDADGNYITMLRDSSNTVTGSDVYASLAGLPDFLTENAAVRDQLIKWQTDWMDKFDIDYYRVDTVKHVDATTWSAFKNSLTAVNPAFKMTGEYAGAGYANNADQLGTGRMDALLDFDFNDFAANFVTGNISSVESSLSRRNGALNNTATMSSFLNSHDENGLQYTLQNNKGLSAAEARDLMKVAASLMITAKGQPVIYYGEEIGQYGQDNYPYQTNRYDFDWAELAVQQADSNSIYNHYKTMLAIRNAYTDVFARGDRQTVLMSDAEGYDVISRTYGETTFYIGMNISSEARTLQIPVSEAEGTVYTNLYDGAEYAVAADGTITVTIPAAKDGGTVVLTDDLRLRIPVSGDFTEVITTAGKVQEGTTITVVMSDSTDVPKTVFEAVQGKDITLEFEVDDSVKWIVNGKDVTKDVKSVNLRVLLGDKADPISDIPDSKIKECAGDNQTLLLSLVHDGELDFTAQLVLNVTTEYAGKYANLFYYNEKAGSLEYNQDGKVDSDGNIIFTFTHASDYVIVFSAESMKPENKPANSEQNTVVPVVKTEAPKTGDDTPIAGTAMVLMFSITLLAAIIGKKRRNI